MVSADMGVMAPGTHKSYTRTAKTLHWLIALLIISQFVGGWLMTHLSISTQTEYFVYQMHKSFGFVVLALSLYRLFWRLSHPAPALPDAMPPWQQRVASLTHVGFYALMIGIPLLGWALVSADPYQIPTKIFFLIPVPHMPLPVSEAVAGFFSESHEVAAIGAMVLLVLHAGAALKHHFADRDDVLTRMLPDLTGAATRWLMRCWTAIVATSLAALAVGVFLVASADNSEALPPAAERVAENGAPGGEGGGAPVAAVEQDSPFAWTIIPDATYIQLSGSAFGGTQSVRLPSIKASIILDPDNPEAAGAISATIDVTALTGGGEIVERLLGDTWFNAAAFPTATFEADAVSGGAGEYVATGTLSVREASIPLDLPFTLAIDEAGRAVADGTVTVSRSALGLGAGASGVDDEVRVTVRVEATR